MGLSKTYKINCPQNSLSPFMKVSIIGPVPVHWGGGFGWRGGGISSHVQGVLPRLAENGVQINFLADNSDASKSFSFPDLNPEITLVPAERSPLRLFSHNIFRNLMIGSMMLKTAELRPTLPTQFLRFWAQAANYSRFLEDFPHQILHVHQAFNRQFLCQSVLQIDKPIVVTAHSINTLLEPHPDWAEKMIFANYRRADWFIAVSNFVKEKIVEFGADPKKVTVIPNGVDADKFSPGSKLEVREKLHLPSDAFLFLYIGNLINRKGIDVLIKAFSQVNQSRADTGLFIIGDGPQLQELEQLARDCKVADKVSFEGYKDFDEMPIWYRAADVFVMPSWAEGLSMSVLEAMASGCVVITTRPQSGIHDAVEPDKTGLLVDYGDVDQLAHAMLALSNSEELLTELADNSRRAAISKFDWSTIARQTADVYHHVLHEKRILV